jgi:hypothetical protein
MQLKSGGFKPNTMVVGKEVRDILINHPDILARLNGGATVSNTALITNAKLAEIFEVENFYVMEAVRTARLKVLQKATPSSVVTCPAGLHSFVGWSDDPCCWSDLCLEQPARCTRTWA